MKIVYINVVCYGSTGRIVHDLQNEANRLGYKTITFYGRGKGFKDLNCQKISNNIDFFIHASLATIFGRTGLFSIAVTKNLIKNLKKINPDIIHLHNIHGFYVNYPILFQYLNNEYSGKVIWTLHDCWSITGNCASFSQNSCLKWKDQCQKCKYKSSYPPCVFDNSKKNYMLKKKLFCNNKNINFTVPSNWLNNIIKESFLKDSNVTVIENYVNNKIFKKIVLSKEIYLKYKISFEAKIYLCIANVWSTLKGIDIINKIALSLNSDEHLLIVGKINKKYKIKKNNVTYINRTDSIDELVKIYNVSDVFINPSRAESFSLVTLESIFCHTPVVVYDNLAVKDLILNNNVGAIISYNESFPEKAFLLEARKIKNKISEKEINNYEKIYSYKSVMKKYMNLYNKVSKSNDERTTK